MPTSYPGGLHDPTGKEQQFQDEVSGRRCRVSRVRNIRSDMPTRYQVGAAGSPGLGTTNLTKSHMPTRYQIQHVYDVSGWGCKVSRVRNIKSNMPMRYQFGSVGSHGFGTTDPTSLRGIRTGLQDLTGKEH